MLDVDNTQPKLPVVKIERKVALKVNTSMVQFKPTALPMFSHNVHNYVKTDDPIITITEKKLRKDSKAVWAERVQSQPVTRYWESTTKKLFPPATPITIPDIVGTGKDDKENLPVIRSKSAPTKLVYLDKSGNLSSRTGRENRLTRSCRAAIGRQNGESDTKKGNSEIVRHSLGYSSHKKEAWNYVPRCHGGGFSNQAGRKSGADSATPVVGSRNNTDIDANTTKETETGGRDPNDNKRNASQNITMLEHSYKTVDGIKVSSIARARVVRNQNLRVQYDVLKHLKDAFVQERRKVRHCATFTSSDGDLELSPDSSIGTRKVSGLFHNTIHFVRMVVRLLVSMTDLSADMTSRSATEERWHAINTSRQVREMAFNKTAFAKRKDFYKLPRWAKEILEKDPEDRNDTELRRIHALLRGLKSFDKFTEKIQLSMCRSFTYHSVGSGRIVLRQGHVGVNFYFLYTGSVFVNTEDTDAQGNKFSKTEVVLRRGDSFGELALLQDIRRTATISCREDCELLVVDKDTFAKVCPKIFEKELEEKLKFLSRLPLFSPKYWSKETLEKICFEAQIQEYKTNKVVVADNSKDEWIYLCMNGKCQIIRRLNLGEELEWRKLQRSAVGRLSSGNRLDEMDARGSIAERGTSVDDEDGRSIVTDIEEGKTRLLESMGLDYRKARKKTQRQSSGKRDVQSKSATPLSEQGQLTLTSFIRQEGANGQEYLYLNIKSLQQGEVFDLLTVLDCHRGEVDMSGSYLLVSNGARVMRIRRSSFFKHAKAPCLHHAKKITKRHRLPPDDVLLRCYRDQLNWQVYKQMILKDTYETLKHEKYKTNGHARFSYNDSAGEVTIDIDEAKKQTIREIQHVLPDEEQTGTDVQYWKKLETLSNKVIKDSKKQKVVAFQLDPEHEAKRVTIHVSSEQQMASELCNVQNATYKMASQMYLGQRRGSVATGDLRRENLRQHSDQRRFSQPNIDFAVIQEEEDDFLSDY